MLTGRRRGARVVLAVLVALLVLAGCGGTAAPTTPPAPLRILLIGANGWMSPGTVALRDALKRAGHTVVEVAPLTDHSSSGTAVTLPPAETVAGPPTGDRELWVTTGTPADATLLGLHAIMGNDPPNLVIAGIDPRANVSVSAMSSGTVGAALTASGIGVPAVALSIALPDPANPPPGAFAAPADFAVRLVAALSQRPAGAPIMPEQTMLNVNFPAGPARGVVAATAAAGPAQTVSFRSGGKPGTFVAVSTPNTPSGRGDDTSALAAGDIVLSDLTANPDRTEPPPRTAVRLAPMLSP